MTWRSVSEVSYGKMVRHAALRAPICLHDGTEARLVAWNGPGRNARIEFADGRRRTVPGRLIGHVDLFPMDATPRGAA